MRAVKQHSHFRRDWKRVKRYGTCPFEEIADAIILLQADAVLPEKYRDHALKGEWEPARECHIRPDLLLVYEKSGTVLHLLRLGSHSELF